MLSKKLSVVFMLGILLLAACASNSDLPEIDSQHGAKRGWIAKIYSHDDDPSIDFPECQAALSKTAPGIKHFVKVEFRHVRLRFSSLVEASDALQEKMGDQVEFWPEDCSHGKFGRVSRVLSSVSQ